MITIHVLLFVFLLIVAFVLGGALVCLCVSSGDVDRADRETRLRVSLCKAVRVMENDPTVDKGKAIAEAYKVLGRQE